MNEEGDRVNTITKFIFFTFIVVLGVLYGIYKSSYNISNISYLNSPPPSFYFILPSSIPGIVSTGLIFPFTYMFT
jgi:hypothetical protein